MIGRACLAGVVLQRVVLQMRVQHLGGQQFEPLAGVAVVPPGGGAEGLQAAGRGPCQGRARSAARGSKPAPSQSASAFRQMIENWHISDFHVSDARASQEDGFSEHLPPTAKTCHWRPTIFTNTIARDSMLCLQPCSDAYPVFV